MSLKAKIEAIIYAAEEPVTLAQLMGLLGQEAQMELDRLAAQQGQLALDGAVGGEEFPLPSEPEGLNEEIFPASGPIGEAALDEDGVAGGMPDRAETMETQVADPGGVDARADARAGRERERALRGFFRQLLDELISEYATSDRGLEIREVANGFRLATKPEYHDAVRGFAKSLKPPLKLSLQALETLAVVAYKQPVTAPEVAEIRGVDSGGVLGSLMARKLVTTAGRKQVIGRPILYRTTKEFLLRFGLKDVGELPGIEEFEKMASELAENEPVLDHLDRSEEKAMGERSPGGDSVTGANLREEEDATEPQADGSSEVIDAMPVDGRISPPPAPERTPVDSRPGTRRSRTTSRTR